MSVLVQLPSDLWRDHIVPLVGSLADLNRFENALVSDKDVSTFRTNIRGSKKFSHFSVSEDKLLLIAWCSIVSIKPNQVHFDTNFVLDYFPQLGHFVSNARYLSFSGCVFQPNEALEILLQHCTTQLKWLSFEGKCDLVDLVGLSSCANLTRLQLSDCRNLTEISLLTSFRELTQLNDLWIDNCPLLTSATINAALVHCRSLEHLRLSGKNSLEGAFTDVPTAPALIQLSVSGWQLTSHTIRSLAAVAPNLYSLYLNSSNSSVTDDDVDFLVKICTSIKRLEIRKFRLTTDASLISIATHLRRLRLFKIVVSSLSTISDIGFTALAQNCPDLWYLTIDGSRLITDVAIQTFGTHCRFLMVISLEDCVNVTDRAFDTLNTECVWCIDASGTRVTGNFPSELFIDPKLVGKLVNPRILRLNRCAHLSDSLVDFVASRFRLSELSIARNSMPRDTLLRLAQSCAGRQCKNVNISYSMHADEEVVQAFRDHNPQLQEFSALGCGASSEE